MNARVAIFSAALLGLSCRDIAGIKPIAYSDAGTSTCNAPAAKVLFDSGTTYDAITATGGFVYLESTSGVKRCATSGCPGGATNVAMPAITATFGSSTLNGTVIDYTVQSGATGEVHSVGLDGTGDQLLLGNLAYPFWIAASGSRVFFVSDPYNTDGTPDSVSCIGCGGTGATPWIASAALPGAVWAIVADATNIYVLADDAALSSYDLLSCSVQTACGSTPKKLAGAIDPSTTQVQLATDGTYVYVARADHEDVIRVDSTGNLSQVVTSQDVTALAVDVAAKNLYIGTQNGIVARVSSSGGSITTLGCVADPIAAIAVDDAVYFVAGPNAATVYSVAK